MRTVYIETNTSDVYLNFGYEHYIANSDMLDKTGADCIFLFWQTQPTLMLGKYQNFAEEINAEYVRENNVNVVRRYSGGGTIYTDMGGFQFTFITRDESGEISFVEYMQPVLDALHDLGVNAVASGRNDILIDGRKISGNAQFKMGKCTVHHGSLLFDTDLEAIVRATNVADYKIISKGIKSVRERVTNIREHLPHDMNCAEFKAEIVEHILSGGTVYEMTSEEIALCNEAADKYFRGWENIYGKTPKFSVTKSAVLKGGKIQFSLDVKKGVIENCAVCGDFFASCDTKELCNAICGTKYDVDEIVRCLDEKGFSGAIFGISTMDIAKLIVQ